MASFSALLPCVVVIGAILWLRLSAVSAAALAMTTALLIWLAGVFVPPSPAALSAALLDAFVLVLLVAAVIVPGILFVEITGRIGAPAAIGSVMRELKLEDAKSAIVVATGIGVMLESLTGFGVSLLVTVPLLLAILDRQRAIAFALIGMSLMPWGALSISAHLGAELAGLSVSSLASMAWWISGPVALVLPVLCYCFAPNRSAGVLGFSVCCGVVLVGAIGLATHFVGVEIAGVAGGMAVIAFSLLIAEKQVRLADTLSRPELLPYGLLILAVVLQNLIVPWLATVGLEPAVSTERVKFSLMTSPGVSLLVATAVSIWLFQSRLQSPAAVSRPLVVNLWQRGWRPLLSILFFMISARLLLEADAIAALADVLAGLGAYPALVAVTLLGAISGYITGGGLAGNALFMPSAAAVGERLDALPLFAALQHGAAGHVAMAALPVVAILLAALPSREASDERTTIAVGLQLSLVFVLLLIAAGLLALISRRQGYG